MRNMHELPKVVIRGPHGNVMHVPGISHMHITPHIMQNLEKAAEKGIIRLQAKLRGSHPLVIITMTEKSLRV